MNPRDTFSASTFAASAAAGHNSSAAVVLFFSGLAVLLTIALLLVGCKFYNDYSERTLSSLNKSGTGDGGYTNSCSGGGGKKSRRTMRPKKFRTFTANGHLVIFKQKLWLGFSRPTVLMDHQRLARPHLRLAPEMTETDNDTRGHYFSASSPHLPNKCSDYLTTDDDFNEENDDYLSVVTLDSSRDENVKNYQDKDSFRKNSAAGASTTCTISEDDSPNRYGCSSSTSNIQVTSPEIFV